MGEGDLLDLERRLGLDGHVAPLRETLAEGPEPEASLRRAVRVLEAAAGVDAAGLAERWRQAPQRLAALLGAIAGVAPFLAPLVARDPPWLLALLDDDLDRPRPAAEYVRRLEEALDSISQAETRAALRRFKYRELARITARDCNPDWVPEERAGETLAELSHLADALLSCALDRAARQLTEALGAPRWTSASSLPVALRFAVLGLGKLGSEELNYSSDVDLVYVFESPAPGTGELHDGPGGVDPAAYFTRLAQEFGRLVAEKTADGFLYRVDLDLRPEGAQGPTVVSSEALAAYYDGRADTWEKAAFMKARPVAGDLAFGWRVIRSLDPMIYRSAMDFAGVAAIRRMKQGIESERLKAGDGFDVKLGAGGIRDLEFVVQALQLLHAGRIPQLRHRSTQQAVVLLAETGILPPEQAQSLLTAYRFLRRVENRLQMRAEQQTHRVPDAPDERERIARALGLHGPDALARFDGRLEEQRERVRQIFRSLLHQEDDERVLALFERNVPRLLAVKATRGQVEELARQFAREVEASAHAERAMNNLDRFIQGVGAHSVYYGLLLDRPELVPRLSALFASSNYLSMLLAAHPALIEPVFRDPNVLVPPRAELEADFEALVAELAPGADQDPFESGLSALRRFRHRHVVNVGLLDVAGKISLAEAEAALTEVAEVCLERGLEIAGQQLHRQLGMPSEAPGEFLVVGMGKLGSRELGYGSDLDVIFLYQEPEAGWSARLPAMEYFVRLAQKLLFTLQTRTGEGRCYEVDPRLRPSGQQGMLVTSLAGFERYHAESAQVWERQALLRARPAAGSAALGRRFEALRREIVGRPAPPALAAELRRIRQRMERELAREERGRHDFKTGRGGLVDVETVVQFLQLRHGPEHPELLEAAPTHALLARLAAHGCLEPSRAADLEAGLDFLRRLSSRLRIVENRSISDLDEERGDLASVARSMGYPAAARAGGERARLLADYRRHTEAIRRAYAEILGGEENGGDGADASSS